MCIFQIRIYAEKHGWCTLLHVESHQRHRIELGTTEAVMILGHLQDQLAKLGIINRTDGVELDAIFRFSGEKAIII